MNRSMLFIPGNTPGMMMKSDFLGADTIIFDLEDAVSYKEKDAARCLVAHFLREVAVRNINVAVRINGMDTGLWEADLKAIVPILNGNIIVPKVENPESVCRLEQLIYAACEDNPQAPGVMAMLETAKGIENAGRIANASPVMKGLLLGGEDLTADLGCRRTPEGEEIRYARYRVVNAAASAGLLSYDTPFTDIGNEEGLRKDAGTAKGLGFSGKLAIHPSQVRLINQIFSSSEDEIAYAKEVLAAYAEAAEKGIGAVSLHGNMIDVPVVERAKRLLSEVAV